MSAPKPIHDRGFRHEAVLYAGERDFVEALVAFIVDGLRREQPVLAVLAVDKIALLRRELGRDADRVAFADMAEVGRNPARIIPAWHAFVSESAAPGRPVRAIGEPISPDRGVDELAECHVHESLLNVAFADAQMWLVCPYDTARLDPSVIEDALQTHPYVASDGTRRASEAYRSDVVVGNRALVDPPGDARRFDYDVSTLRNVRAFVGDNALRLGLGSELAGTLVFVANELATNSLRYGGGHGRVVLWRSGGGVVCDVSDDGWIREPLVGRVRPACEQESGRGVWLANQLCDLVQIRTAATGTTIRVHLAG